jgi:hypothetical protein
MILFLNSFAFASLADRVILNPVDSNPHSQVGKDEELDYEPDEDNDDIEKESSDSSDSDSEVEDNDAAKALFMEKFKAGLTAKKVDFTETKDGLSCRRARGRGSPGRRGGKRARYVAPVAPGPMHVRAARFLARALVSSSSSEEFS